MKPPELHIDKSSVLGFDYGTRRIGVAVGNPTLKAARGLGVVHVSQGRPNKQQIEEFVDIWQPSRFIVGIPITLDKNKTPLHREILRFSNWLDSRFNLPVEFVNESYSTEESNFRMSEFKIKRKKKPEVRNQLAAEVILETYFSESCK